MDELRKHSFVNLLELGPGGGALTKELLKLEGIHFKAVEIDREKVQHLRKSFRDAGDFIIEEDFLQMKMPFSEPFSVIGNFPYNISTEIIFRILDWKEQVPLVIGMFQKEVAQRIASGPGSKAFGVTSALVQPFYEVEYLFDVPPSSFQPPPKVTSGVIKLLRKSESLPVRSRKDYVLLVKTAFNQRRKMLRNALKPLFSPEELANPVFSKRAEQLGIEDFAGLTFRMKQQSGANPDKASNNL